MKKGVQSMDLALQGLRLEVMSSDQACLLVHCPDNDYVLLCVCVCVCGYALQEASCFAPCC